MASLNKFIKEFGMSKIIEKITAIKKDTVKSGKNVGKPYYRVTLGNGDMAFAWSWPVIKDITVGQMAEMVIESNGKFMNIKAAVPIQASGTDEIPSDDEAPFDEDVEVEEVEEKKGKPITPRVSGYSVSNKDDYWNAKFEHDIEKDIAITRMSCLKTAVEYCNYCKPVDAAKFKPLTEEDVVSVAKLFFGYITTGKYEEEE